MSLVVVALLIQLQDTIASSTARPDLVHRNGRIPPSVTAIPAPAPPRIDGRLDEPWWQAAIPATDFRRDVPSDGNPASERSEVRVAYDRDALYIGARLYHRDTTAISRRLSRRDSFSVFNDVFFGMIDSYHDHRTAFVFGVTPAGEQRDMLTTSDGGNRDASWDPVWETKTLIDSLGWAADGPGPAVPIVFGEPHFRVRSLRSNLVVRWEYRPGSTVFVVWNQNRAFRATDPRFRALSDLGDIWNDDQQNVFLIKASYYFSL